MIGIHRGAPNHPTALRFAYGAIFRRKPEPKGQNVFYSRDVKSWLGISWHGSWFFGFIRLGDQKREDVALKPDELNELLTNPVE